MSTVYNGKIVKRASLIDIFNQVKSKYNEFYNLFENQIKQDFVKELYRSIDFALIKDDKSKEKSIYDLANEYTKSIYELNKNRVYRLIICFFPYKRDVLIMNCSDYLYDEIFNSFGFEDFSYWNNSDKPEDISTYQWKKRLEIWDKVCPTTPANNSLMYAPYFLEITSLPYLWKYKDLKIHLEKFNKEKRFEMYCKNHEFANEYFAKKKPNPWINIKDKMFDITEENFKDNFIMNKMILNSH